MYCHIFLTISMAYCEFYLVNIILVWQLRCTILSVINDIHTYCLRTYYGTETVANRQYILKPFFYVCMCSFASSGLAVYVWMKWVDSLWTSKYVFKFQLPRIFLKKNLKTTKEGVLQQFLRSKPLNTFKS